MREIRRTKKTWYWREYFFSCGFFSSPFPLLFLLTIFINLYAPFFNAHNIGYPPVVKRHNIPSANNSGTLAPQASESSTPSSAGDLFFQPVGNEISQERFNPFPAPASGKPWNILASLPLLRGFSGLRPPLVDDGQALPFEDGKIVGFQGVSCLREAVHLDQVIHPGTKQRIKALQGLPRRMVFNIPFRITSLFRHPLQEFFKLYLQRGDVFPEVADQFFITPSSISALSPSSSSAAEIFQDGLT